MMNKSALMISCVLSLFLSSQAIAGDSNKAKLKKEAISIVKKFGGTLKPELKKALKAGGPVKAIHVCSIKAPEIAKKLSAETGWIVKRVSLKATQPQNSNAGCMGNKSAKAV